MKKWLRSGLGVLLILMLTIGLTACGEKEEAVQKVRVAEVTRSIFYAPEYVAIEKGFFKEEGLKRGINYVESGPLVRSSYHAERHVHV